MFLDVDCPRCDAHNRFDVPLSAAGQTDYPVTCSECKADFHLWLDPQHFMLP